MVTVSKRDVEKPQAQGIIDRIGELRPWLREQQPVAEQQRRVPQETVERLDATGVFSVTTPTRFGGPDFTARELLEIYRVLASGCGATAWMVWAAAGGNGWSFAFPDEVVEPVFTGAWVGNRTFAVGGATPSRRMVGFGRQVDGGWMVTGAWPFATGSVHASHGYLTVFYSETDDSKIGIALVPKDSLVLRDDWDPIGLAGTGSGTVATDGEIFVPNDHFGTLDQFEERIADRFREGRGPRRGGLTRGGVVGAGLALGMADHAMEAYLQAIERRNIPGTPYAKQLEAPITHLTVGRAHNQIRAAAAVAESAMSALDRYDAEDREPSEQEVLQLHADAAYVWDACASAVEMLYRGSGASAVLKRQPLQLIARNCRAGSLHAGFNIDTRMENLGRAICGIV